MKTPMSVFVLGVAGCFSSALLHAAFVPLAAAADSSTTLSLLQQPSMIEAVAKAQASGTSPIVTSPSALVLQAQKGQTAVGTLSLKKSGTDQHTYYLSTNQSWVWMNPPYGSTQTISSEADQIVITAQTANLSAGTYSALVYIVDSGPNNFTNMLRIPVTFTVTATPVAATPPPPAPPVATPPPPPVVLTPPPPPPAAVTPPPAPPVVSTTGIAASPVALALSAVKGQTAVGTLALRKGGTDQHSYYLSTNQSWIWMNPPYGSTQTITSETDQLVITAQTASLSAGTYSATLYIVESGPNNFSNMLRIPVTLTVTASPVAATPPPAPPAATPPPPVPVVATPPPPAPAPPAPAPAAPTSVAT
ncbi:MAG: BACON domain-containing protein, partial [Nitrospira sp.]